MKTIKYFAVISLLAGMSGCNSKPDLDGFREVEISNNIPDTINPIYRERLWDFVFYPQITYEVESRYLGIYQRRKTVIKGIGLGMITGKEEEYIKSRQK